MQTAIAIDNEEDYINKLMKKRSVISIEMMSLHLKTKSLLFVKRDYAVRRRRVFSKTKTTTPLLPIIGINKVNIPISPKSKRFPKMADV